MHYSKTKMVMKGTTCYGTLVGWGAFYYPDQDKKCIFVSDAVVMKLPWVSSQKLVAVKVAKGFIEGDIGIGGEKDVVWIKPDDIRAY